MFYVSFKCWLLTFSGYLVFEKLPQEFRRYIKKRSIELLKYWMTIKIKEEKENFFLFHVYGWASFCGKNAKQLLCKQKLITHLGLKLLLSRQFECFSFVQIWVLRKWKLNRQNSRLRSFSLWQIPKSHQISWRRNFVERHSFRIVSGELPKTMWKLCVSIKFPYQKIRWNYGIFCSVYTFFLKQTLIDCRN